MDSNFGHQNSIKMTKISNEALRKSGICLNSMANKEFKNINYDSYIMIECFRNGLVILVILKVNNSSLVPSSLVMSKNVIITPKNCPRLRIL